MCLVASHHLKDFDALERAVLANVAFKSLEATADSDHHARVLNQQHGLLSSYHVVALILWVLLLDL